MNEEDQVIDSTPEVFKEENENVDELGPEIIEDKNPVYLINAGRPARITVANQLKVTWLDYRAKRFTVQVIMYRDGHDNRDAEAMKLSSDEKCFVYYDARGNVLSKKVKPVSFSFEVLDYPHVIDYPIGQNKFDERKYTIKCGVYDPNTGSMSDEPLATLINSRADLNILLERFPFLEECYKDGKPKAVSEYRKNLGSKRAKVEGNINWANMQEVPDDRLPTKNPRKEAINAKPMPKLDEGEE